MYAEKESGLGILPAIVPIIISAVASVGGSAVSAKLGKPETPDYSALQKAQAEEARKNAIWIGAGGILLIFILTAMRR